MCGRYSFFARGKDLSRAFAALTVPDDFDERTPQRYNIAPTQTVLAISNESSTQLISMRWGLIPSWAKKIGTPLINARVETISEKPSFRSAFASRHCVLPADGWYEWIAGPTHRQGLRIEAKDQRVFGFAGIWERWKSPTGEMITSCSIITRRATDVLASVHERMPVVLDGERSTEWLDVHRPHPEAILLSQPAIEFVVFPVGKGVNNARNEGSTLREPILYEN